MKIYVLVGAADWRRAEKAGVYEGSADDARDGFIHFSTAVQVAESAWKHRRGVKDLLLVAVDPDGLGPALQYEPSRGGALFPHLYGPLSLEHVHSVVPLSLDAAGRHKFPAEIPPFEAGE
ncbi:DUF952 domain-containing protein [Oceanibacterium hippocampi]|uniref:DUF952 domain-containing protein n=1 Tax=Oceanibacterium hippocampi TaxID=745714 RepID=A0A1Y5RCR6_9PROT|nr:DUF952 domain-containing protein [Oceanibacterium hippocampi]SLN11888.1 hypothetical protein OCH7691_00110 [Oceanibacterium hippocampi]